MKVYRSPMEKRIDEMENEVVITNPKEPLRTFLRKAAYRWEICKSWLTRSRVGAGGRDQGGSR